MKGRYRELRGYRVVYIFWKLVNENVEDYRGYREDMQGMLGNIRDTR